MTLAQILLLRWRTEADLYKHGAAELIDISDSMYNDLESGKKGPGVNVAVSVETVTEGAVPVWAWTVDLTDEKQASRVFAREKARRAA